MVIEPTTTVTEDIDLHAWIEDYYCDLIHLNELTDPSARVRFFSSLYEDGQVITWVAKLREGIWSCYEIDDDLREFINEFPDEVDLG